MLVDNLPLESATARALHGASTHWTLTDHLLALIVDRLAVISWQLGGGRRNTYPKPLPRPGVTDALVRHGRTNRPTAEVVAYLRRFAPAKDEEVSADG